MFTVCWGAKGGSGTTVVAATLALSGAPPTLLVDLAGDLPLALGVAAPAGPGVAEWSKSAADTSRLDALRVRVAPGLDLLPLGHDRPAGRWDDLARHLRRVEGVVVVDAGTGPPPVALCRAADRSWLVTRPCYLALTRATESRGSVDGVVLVEEPGRALSPEDVEAAIGAPVVARVLLDPAIARAVDSGLLLARLPGAFRRAVEAAA